MVRQRLTPKTIALAALLIALNIVLARFFAFMVMGGALRLSLSVVPLMLSGILLGPFVGALCGIVADLIGVMINPQGSLFLGYTFSYALIGFISGAVFFVKPREVHGIIRFLLAEVLVSLIPLLFFNTLWVIILQGQAVLAILPMRLLSRAILAPIELFITYSLYRVYLVARR